jgi:hypothetical protein
MHGLVIPWSRAFGALFARSENLKCRALGREHSVSTHLTLQAIQSFVHELNDIAAFKTNHVMMMRLSGCPFIPSAAFVEPVLRNQAATLKQFKGIVDSRPGNFDALSDKPVVESLGIKMSLDQNDFIKNCMTLWSRPAIAIRFKEFCENIVCCSRIHCHCLDLV